MPGPRPQRAAAVRPERIQPHIRNRIFPAVVMQILQLGLVTPSVPVLRACTCLVVQFLWFARADTCIHLRQDHVGVGAFGITLSERNKTIARHVAAPMTRPCLAAWDPEGFVLRLLRR